MQHAIADLPVGALIGVLHLPPLPGAPSGAGSFEQAVENTLREARALAEARFDALIAENFGDAPFSSGRVGAHTVAAMAVVLRELAGRVPVPIGVNMLRNDAVSALAVAAVAGGRFIRVNVHTGVYATDQGIIHGRAHRTVRYRDALRSDVAILADVFVKHAAPMMIGDLAQAAEEVAYRGRADGLIVTGTATGRAASVDDVKTVRAAVPDRPVFVGSGVTAATVRQWLDVADGVIVGSDLRSGGRAGHTLDAKRVEAFVKAAGR